MCQYGTAVIQQGGSGINIQNFYDSPSKNKSKYILKIGTYMLSTWIKSITGHNNLAYFQSKLNPEIDPHADYAYKLMKPFTI